jgi:Family of unknown function (DUF6188)
LYGLSKDIDLSFLVGRQVEQVAISAYQVQFRFDEDVTISVESHFRYFDGQQEWIWKPEPGAAHAAGRTASLLTATIERFEVQENSALFLVFSNGHRLSIFDSSKEYQSYDITRPGQTIIV